MRRVSRHPNVKDSSSREIGEATKRNRLLALL